MKKKTNCNGTDELRSEYKRSDFGKIVRGKYAARIGAGTNVVVPEPEIAKAFPNEKAVNEALRGLLDAAATTARLTRRSIGRAKQQRTREIAGRITGRHLAHSSAWRKHDLLVSHRRQSRAPTQNCV
jgi:biotin-(acetyl-CoA carboxylase) ligase